jgi:acyl-CoA thioesterase-1
MTEVAIDAPSRGRRLRYVALGDSYTIGTSVSEPDRWPNQLVAALGGSAGPIELVANLGVNGYTSADLIRAELPRLPELAPDFVTVLIGVNDVVQGVPEGRYRGNLERIFDALLAQFPADRIVVVTTPDYTVTPAGADYGDPDTQRTAIQRFNATAAEVATARGVAVVDIFDVSERAASDPSLVASDGLHPSRGQYALWVDRITPVVGRLLGAGR